MLDLARRVIADAITSEVLAAVEAGETGRMREAMRRPSGSTVLALAVVKRVQREAFAAGRKEGDAALRQVFADRGGVEVFDGRAEVLRERAAAAARTREFRATREEMRQAREQARNLIKSFIAHARDGIAAVMGKARAGGKGFTDARDLVEQVKRGDPSSPAARGLMRGITTGIKGVAATPILEVDWQASRRGLVDRWKAVVESKTEEGRKVDAGLLVDYTSEMDDETTPACQFLDGATLASDDARVAEYNPQLHYG